MVKRVKGITTLTGSGAKDWFFQRLSGIILAIYTLFLVGFMISHAPLDYPTWFNLFSHTAMKIFTVLALLSLIWHAWIGIWTVFSDYVTIASIRVILQVLVILVLVVCFLWAIHIVW